MHPSTARWESRLALCVVLIALAVPAGAQEPDPVFMIGASALGLHTLRTTDGVRQRFQNTDDRISLSQAFAEWFPRARWGLAYRALTLGYPGLADRGQPYTLQAHTLGLQYLPFVSEDRRLRLALYGAAGSAAYEYGYNVLGAHYSGQTGGRTYLAGIYLDGSRAADRVVGFRAGWGWLWSALRDVEINGSRYDADLSGHHVYLDVRAAF